MLDLGRGRWAVSQKHNCVHDDDNKRNQDDDNKRNIPVVQT